MPESQIKTHGGTPLADLTLANVLDGQLGPDDFRISADTLLMQARAAEAGGQGPLADNFRRAAELTRLSNREVLDTYNLLRPGRASREELLALADHLEQKYNAPINAALVRETARVYAERGLLKG